MREERAEQVDAQDPVPPRARWGVPSLPIVRTAVPVPAQFTPTRAGILGGDGHRLGHLLAVGDVGLDELDAELLGQGVALVAVEVEDRDHGAGGLQPSGGGLTQPRRSTRDDRCSTLDVHGRAGYGAWCPRARRGGAVGGVDGGAMAGGLAPGAGVPSELHPSGGGLRAVAAAAGREHAQDVAGPSRTVHLSGSRSARLSSPPGSSQFSPAAPGPPPARPHGDRPAAR